MGLAEAEGIVRETCRLHGVFAAFAALGVEAEPVVYSDDSVDAVREQLLGLDGVLVWVNPIEQGLDRSGSIRCCARSPAQASGSARIRT